MELDDTIHDQVTALSEEGDLLSEDERFDEAIKKYQVALNLLPSPKQQWEACTWLYVAIGDAYFLEEDYPLAFNYFMDAFNCPDANDNPFIHLRAGQTAYRINNEEKAVDSLLRAYMLEGEDIFKNDDPIYFEFLQSKVNL
ncbi:MAG: hypothetical protein L3J00_03705 [Thiomicrorhabdus sp.]|nr:hypothetical protein [Thiomicrorhabdus sp.]